MGSFHTKVFFKCLQLKTTFGPTWSNQIYLCSQYSHSKSKVKFSLFVLSKKLSQYCDCVYPVFLTKTCGLSHGISLWDWVLGGTGRRAPNLNVISYCKASKMFQQQWQRDNSKSIGESLCNFLKILNLTSDNMFQIQWGSEHFLIKGN